MRKMCVLLALVLAGCAAEEAPGPLVMDEEELGRWEIELVEMRIEKNEACADSAQTPLRVEDLPAFEGLEYYYPEPSMRFQIPFVEAAGTDTVTMVKRKGEQVPYLRRGTVSFHAEGRDVTLAVFGPADRSHGDYLWLPFYDATNGEETFGGGRYLDIAIEDDGTIELDFNFAYNPLCDYDPERYNCTLPPEENTVPFPIRAGEKLLHGRAH